MRPALALAAALLPTLLLSGCLYARGTGYFGSRLDPEVVARIVPGKSTKADVLDLLGPPREFLRSEVVGSLGDETTRVNGAVALGNRAQDAFSYQRDRFQARASFLLLYNVVRSNVVSDLLVVFFDAEDRVREVSVRWAESSR